MIKKILLLTAMTIANFGYCTERTTIEWGEVKNIENRTLLADAHYIDGFHFIPAMKGIPPLANCMAQLIQHNSINTGIELREYFDSFCSQHGIAEKLKKQLKYKVLNDFYQKLEKSKASSGKGWGELRKRYERKNFPQDGRWLRSGENSALLAWYFIKKSKSIFSSQLDISNLRKAIKYYSEEYNLTYRYSFESEFNVEKVKGYLLRNKPVLLHNGTELLVAYGFVDHDKILVYNPITAEICKKKGKDVYMRALRHKLSPTSSTLQRIKEDWFFEYVASINDSHSPKIVDPVSIQIMTVKQIKEQKYDCAYLDEFKLNVVILNKFDKQLKEYLDDMDKGE